MGIKLASLRMTVALATVAVVAGCSGGGQLSGSGGAGANDGGAGGTGGEPLAMFASDFQTAFCTPRVACGAFADLATCEAFENFAGSLPLINIVGSVGRGTVIYDPVAAAACIAALPQDCSVTQIDQMGVLEEGGATWALQTIDACVRTFTGTLPLGADCRHYDVECAPSMFCNPIDLCTGTCAAADPPPQLLGVGEACANNFCALPAVCDATCVVPPDHFASCEVQAINHPCRYLDDYCGVAPGATVPTCLPRLAVGAPCSVPSNMVDPCAQKARCIDDGTGATVCVANTVAGGACGGAANRCLSPLFCTNGICGRTPDPTCGT